MKKTLAILTLALFIGGISVPVLASNNNALTQISVVDDDPKKKSKSESSDAKAKKSTKATKSGDCAAEAKSDCATEKKSDCSSKCGGDK